MKFKPENTLAGDVVVEIIDAALQQNRKAQPPRKYLGASRIGEECERRLSYEYHQTPKDEGADFKGKTLRVFDMGHDGEERMAEYLRLAGFLLQTHAEDGKQIGISDAQGRFRGHLDGYIHGGPAVPNLAYPCLWESKALGDKSWNDLKKNGLKKSKPVYYAQVQVYMGYKDLAQCLFTAINRDTGDIHVEIVDFNSRDCQDYVDKVVRILKTAAPEESPRLSRDPSDFRCKFCDFRQRCHGAPAQPETPSNSSTPQWLQKN